MVLKIGLRKLVFVKRQLASHGDISVFGSVYFRKCFGQTIGYARQCMQWSRDYKCGANSCKTLE